MRYLSWLLLVLALPLTTGEAAQAAQAAPPERLIFLGDSITEGYGVSKAAAYPTLVEVALRAKGYKKLQITNAGISGSTSASAQSRLKWLLREPKKATLLFLALGANDGLRGLDVKAMRQHLLDTVRFAKAHGVEQIVIAGMQMPPNYGKEYTKDFAAVFPQVAAEEHTVLLPFLLQDVATDPKLNQADGIHPNDGGHQIIAKNVVSFLLPLLGPAS